jgi:hypothetical protein
MLYDRFHSTQPFSSSFRTTEKVQLAMKGSATAPPASAAPHAAKRLLRPRKHQKDKRAKSKKHKASSTSSRSGSASSTSSSSSADQAAADQAPTVDRKPLFFKRTALPAGSLTHRMLPVAVIKEILHVISPETCAGEQNLLLHF